MVEGLNAIDRFRQIASQKKFQGWPVVGDYERTAKIPFFGEVIHYQLETPNGKEDYYSLLRSFGWSVAFGVTVGNKVITLVQWKPGANQAGWELPPGGIGKVSSDISSAELLLKTQESYLLKNGTTRDRSNIRNRIHPKIFSKNCEDSRRSLSQIAGC